jgi:hypothetical protein
LRERPRLRYRSRARPKPWERSRRLGLAAYDQFAHQHYHSDSDPTDRAPTYTRQNATREATPEAIPGFLSFLSAPEAADKTPDESTTEGSPRSTGPEPETSANTDTTNYARDHPTTASPVVGTRYAFWPDQPGDPVASTESWPVFAPEWLQEFGPGYAAAAHAVPASRCPSSPRFAAASSENCPKADSPRAAACRRLSDDAPATPGPTPGPAPLQDSRPPRMLAPANPPPQREVRFAPAASGRRGALDLGASAGCRETPLKAPGREYPAPRPGLGRAVPTVRTDCQTPRRRGPRPPARRFHLHPGAFRR